MTGLELFDYPASPGFRNRDTSFDAARSMRDSAPILRARCLASLRDHGPATADEVAARLNLSILSVRPRITELSHAGKVEDTGERRANESGRRACVWRAV